MTLASSERDAADADSANRLDEAIAAEADARDEAAAAQSALEQVSITTQPGPGTAHATCGIEVLFVGRGAFGIVNNLTMNADPILPCSCHQHRAAWLQLDVAY